MLKISVVSTASGTTLKLAGLLASPCVDELKTCWEILRAISGERPIFVDLSEVTRVRRRGKELLDRMRCEGVVIVEPYRDGSGDPRRRNLPVEE
jgi:hypothetical protein